MAAPTGSEAEAPAPPPAEESPPAGAGADPRALNELRERLAALDEQTESLSAKTMGVEPQAAQRAQLARRIYGGVAFSVSILIGVGGPLGLILSIAPDAPITAAKSLLVVGMLGFAYALLRAADRFSLDERIIEKIEIARASRKSEDKAAEEESPEQAVLSVLNGAVDVVAKLDELRGGSSKPD